MTQLKELLAQRRELDLRIAEINRTLTQKIFSISWRSESLNENAERWIDENGGTSQIHEDECELEICLPPIKMEQFLQIFPNPIDKDSE